jgi:nucleoside-diphosphate-sugar epimerase
MNVVITGGAGFLGRRLLDRLLQRNVLKDSHGGEHAIERITIVDAVAPAPVADPRVVEVRGDITDASLLQRAIDANTTSIFHLAAVVSAMAEADFDLGMRVNVDASRALLEVVRATGRCPRLVFASSVAVYGGDLPETVLDSTALRPQSSYGAQKAIVELMINDYSRRGFIDGRVLRLPTISVRPGTPNAAASSFASGIIREPLNGDEAICPVDPSTRLWLLSPAAAIDAFLAVHDAPASAIGVNRCVNAPGLSVTVADMVASLERIAGREVTKRIRWQRDPRIERIVATWPGAWDTTRARSLGLVGDENFDEIVRRYMTENSLVP